MNGFFTLAIVAFSLSGFASARALPPNNTYPELADLVAGNQAYVQYMESNHTGLLEELATNGQRGFSVLDNPI